jgi:hypothetical protein
MDGDCSRLNKCSGFYRELRRQLQQGRFREGKELLRNSRGLKPHHLQVLADVIMPFAAR